MLRNAYYGASQHFVYFASQACKLNPNVLYLRIVMMQGWLGTLCSAPLSSTSLIITG